MSYLGVPYSEPLYLVKPKSNLFSDSQNLYRARQSDLEILIRHEAGLSLLALGIDPAAHIADTEHRVQGTALCLPGSF